MEEDKKDKAEVVEVEKTSIKARPFRDRVLRGYNKRNPDNTLPEDVDDETLYESLGKGYKDLEMKGENAVEENSLLMEALANNPEASGILEELFGGKNGESVMADIRKRQELKQKDKALQDEFNTNLETSLGEMNSVFAEMETTDEEKEQVIEFVNNVLNGKITRQMIVEYVQGLRYDADLDVAEKAGEVRGKNAVIDEAKLQMRRGDELPMPKNSGNKTTEKTEAKPSLFGERLNPARFAKRVG